MTVDDILLALGADLIEPEPAAKVETPADDPDEELELTQKAIDDLPDSAFLYVAPGGRKDKSGRTAPRSMRHFQVRDAAGNVDAKAVKSALKKIPKSSAPGLTAERKRNLAERAARLLAESDPKTKGRAAKSIAQAQRVGLVLSWRGEETIDLG